MNLDVFKMQIGGIKSLSIMSDDEFLSVTMANDQKPIFTINKATNQIRMNLENFKGTGLDFGLLTMAISNLYTQDPANSMKPVKAASGIDSDVIGVIKRDDTVRPVAKDINQENLQFTVTKWLMNDFASGDDPLDPLVGLIGLGRMVERSGMASSSLGNQAPAHPQN